MGYSMSFYGERHQHKFFLNRVEVNNEERVKCSGTCYNRCHNQTEQTLETSSSLELFFFYYPRITRFQFHLPLLIVMSFNRFEVECFFLDNSYCASIPEHYSWQFALYKEQGNSRIILKFMEAK